MKLTSHDLKELNIIDEIIEEPLGGIKAPTDSFIKDLRKKLVNKINELSKLDKDKLIDNRYAKFRRIGLE
jgi:acetyl-CoA carboxylase carboxyl transferase subunit alpha